MASVTIVGAGLVGSLLACYFGRRGYEVDLYEARGDIRKSKDFRGRSVNLAISVRGLSALSKLNLTDQIKKECVPMRARLIHNSDGSCKEIPYGKDDQHINSISRNHLNKLLLNIAENFPNVRLHFNQKLKSIDFNKKECRFASILTENKETKIKNLEFSKLNFEIYAKDENSNDKIDNGFNDLNEDSNHDLNKNNKLINYSNLINDEITKKSDIIIGADGAFSKVRNQIMRQPKSMFNYEQMYIDHGYIELTIPPKKIVNSETNEITYEFAMKINYLHIWPRGEFMMIALPNQDKSFTVTLFMPFKNFEKIQNEWDLLDFFKNHFPDSIDLIGRDELINTFFNNKPGSLITIKCSPYYYGNCLLIGDAAHAMVPFYGQGMNCGFEDCLVLDNIIEKLSNGKTIDNFEQVFEEFNRARNENCKTICNLALYNYIEMRHLVNTWSFLIRKKFDNFLNKILGERWMPLYSMVTFSQIPYKDCLENKNSQDRRIDQAMNLVKLVTVIFIFDLTCKRFKLI